MLPERNANVQQASRASIDLGLYGNNIRITSNTDAENMIQQRKQHESRAIKGVLQ
jgi:hypothetical protein